MLKLIKSSFTTTNDCIIVISPLVIFFSLFGLYIDYAEDVINTNLKLIVSIVTIIIMTCGFFSGWFYMLKKAIGLSKRIIVVDSDRKKELFNLLCSLPKGIGKLFLPTLGIGVITSVIAAICYYIIKPFGLDLNLTTCLTVFVLYIYLFLTMLWVPEVVYGEKNPIKALFITIKNITQTVVKSFKIYIYSLFIIVFITSLNTFMMMANPFLYFFVLILYYYFLVYIVVLLFTYYEQEFAY